MQITASSAQPPTSAPRFGWLNEKQLPAFMESGVLNHLDRPTLIEMRDYIGLVHKELAKALEKGKPIDQAIAQKPRYPDYFNPLTTPQRNPIRAIANVLAQLFKSPNYPVPDDLLETLIKEFKSLQALETQKE